jgi:trans-aconitate methyltransferase
MLTKLLCKNYNSYSDLQSIAAFDLLDFLNTRSGSDYSEILEIGCGTGFLTRNILKLTNNVIDAIDISQEMIDFCTNLFPTSNIRFFLIDADKIWQQKSSILQKYDLIISNFTLHWLSDLYFFLLQSIQRSRVLAFSIVVDDSFNDIKNFAALNSIHIPLLTLPNFDKLYDFLVTVSIKKKVFFTKKTYIKDFSDLYSLLKYLKNTGLSNIWHNKGGQNLSFQDGKKIYKNRSECCKLEYSIVNFVIL